MDALAESVAGMSDKEVMDEFGNDPVPRTGTILRAAMKRHNQAKLIAARQQHSLETRALSSRSHNLPTSPMERRTLFAAFMASRPDALAVTAQHRDFKDVTDDDITNLLEQLDDLGFLQPFLKADK